MKRRSILLLAPLLVMTMLMLNSCDEACVDARIECMDNCPTEEEYMDCISDCGPFPGLDATPAEQDAHAACVLSCQKPSDCRDKCNEEFLECEKDN